MKFHLRTLFFILSVFVSVVAGAQSSLDSLSKEVSALKSQVSSLAKSANNFKFSGYIQTQFQYTDTVGAQTLNGGNFPVTSDSRFAVRRMRLRTAYEIPLGSAVVQIDATEKGVTVKSAYINLIAPFDRSLSATAGIFDRPFGFAVAHSSSSMVVLERPIVVQTLFPGEQDLGGKLTYRFGANSMLNGLTVNAGIFNGNGVNPDVDSFKDFIGQLSYNNFRLGDGNSLNVGVSGYYGQVYNPQSVVYEMSDVSGTEVFTPSGKKVGAKLLRRYVGFDGQLAINLPLGEANISSEYIFGRQPGLATTSRSPNYSSLPSSSVYIRNFAGGYVTYIQHIKKFAAFGSYDWYDPNTKVSGNAVGKSVDVSGTMPTNATDLFLSTISVGAMYEPIKNLRFTAQYDFNRYEKTDNGMFAVPGLENNLLTLRVQYKF